MRDVDVATIAQPDVSPLERVLSRMSLDAREGLGMCQAVTARVVRIEPNVAWIDRAGKELPVSLLGIGEVAVGDYLYYQAGLALERLDPAMAQNIQSVLDELDAILRMAEG